MKKRILSIVVGGALVMSVTSALAWNFGNKNIKSLRLSSSGSVQFSLYEAGQSGETVKCDGNAPWFELKRCSATDNACLAATSRMTSMLLTAQVSKKPILIERNECTVTEVALTQ